MVILDGIKFPPMNKGSFLALRLASCAVVLCAFLFHTFAFGQTIPDWEDVSITNTQLFDATCEYRFKINTTVSAGGPAGEYWAYANSVHPQNIIYVSHMGQISHVNADSKTVYRVNGTPITYITMQSLQKRCDTSWVNVDLVGTEAFDTNAEYRFRTNAASAGLGISGGDYWSYSNAVQPDSIVYISHNQTSHINANSKTSYRVDGTPLITVLQMQKRVTTSSWNDISLTSTTPFNTTCEYRFMAGSYTHMINTVGQSSIIYISHIGQTSHINADSKNMYRLDGVGLFGVTKIQERCSTQANALTCGNPRAKVDFVTYDPAITGNSGANAWTSLTLGNKVIIPENQFFDIKDGTYAIDDGTIVSTGLQNFAVSRHDGYVEFLAIGRRLPAYYGYYEGTITFENVQVDRVE